WKVSLPDASSIAFAPKGAVAVGGSGGQGRGLGRYGLARPLVEPARHAADEDLAGLGQHAACEEGVRDLAGPSTPAGELGVRADGGLPGLQVPLAFPEVGDADIGVCALEETGGRAGVGTPRRVVAPAVVGLG